jgi:hypothetical protein
MFKLSPSVRRTSALVAFLALTAFAACSEDPSPGGAGGASSASTANGTGGQTTSGAGGDGDLTPECTNATVTDVCGASTTCAPVACVDGTCRKAIANKNTACNEDGGTICDGEGNCVPKHCEDGKTDEDETDIDCGGACPPCENEKLCKQNGDCASGSCGPVPNMPNALACRECASHDQCDADHYCDATSKTCLSDKAHGASCQEGNECPGNYCTDGVCCDTACDATPCAACSAMLGAKEDGTCTIGAMKGAFDPGLCDETNGGCGGRCACNAAGACAKDLGNLGEACSANKDCKSGFCADGTCCDTACDGLCQACSVEAGAAKDGTCGPVVKVVTDPGNCDETKGGCGGKCACSAGAECKLASQEKCFTNFVCASNTCVKVYQAPTYCK